MLGKLTVRITNHVSRSTYHVLFALTKVVQFGLEGGHEAAKVGTIDGAVVAAQGQVDGVADVKAAVDHHGPLLNRTDC